MVCSHCGQKKWKFTHTKTTCIELRRERLNRSDAEAMKQFMKQELEFERRLREYNKNVKKMVPIAADSLPSQVGDQPKRTKKPILQKRIDYTCGHTGCDFVASYQDELRLHRATHADFTPFTCTFDGCNVQSNGQSMFQEHLNSHTGLKPYKCFEPGCNYRSARRDTMVDHEKTVHCVETPVKCFVEGCNAVLKSKYHQQIHCRVKHKIYSVKFKEICSNLASGNPLRVRGGGDVHELAAEAFLEEIRVEIFENPAVGNAAVVDVAHGGGGDHDGDGREEDDVAIDGLPGVDGIVHEVFEDVEGNVDVAGAPPEEGDNGDVAVDNLPEGGVGDDVGVSGDDDDAVLPDGSDAADAFPGGSDDDDLPGGGDDDDLPDGGDGDDLPDGGDDDDLPDGGDDGDLPGGGDDDDLPGGGDDDDLPGGGDGDNEGENAVQLPGADDPFWGPLINMLPGLGRLSWEFINTLPMGRTVRYVPKKCDKLYTQALERILLLTQHHELQMRHLGAKLFILFPRLFLSTKEWTHIDGFSSAWPIKRKRQAGAIKSRLQNFLNGRFDKWLEKSVFASKLNDDALEERILAALGPSQVEINAEEAESRRMNFISKLVGNGYISKAADKVEQATQKYQLHEAAVESLQAKFVAEHDAEANAAALNEEPEIENPKRVFIDPFNMRGVGYKNVRNAIKGLKKLSTPGLDGWTSEMLRHFLPTAPEVGGNRYANVLLKLTKFLYDLETRSDFEPGFLEFIISGPGFTLPKGNNNPLDMRPVVASSSIWKLFASATILHFKEDLLRELKSTNFAVGLPLGTEVMHHLTRDYIMRNPEDVMAQLDFTNGFNAVKRSAVLAAVAEHMPSLYRAAVLSMGGPNGKASAKFWKSSGNLLTVDILEGVRQGDPLAMAFFCLAIKNPWLLIKSEFIDLFVSAYADDSNVGGHIDVVAAAIPRIAEVFAEQCGLMLNMDKLKLYSRATDMTLEVNRSKFHPDAICIAPEEGIIVMGAPIGSPEYIVGQLNNVIFPKIATFIKQVVALPNTQDAYHILRLSGIPRVTHLVRLVPPCYTEEMTSRFDTLFLNSLDTLAGVPDGTFAGGISRGISSKQQVMWPLRHSGLGFTSFNAIKEVAYFASTMTVSSLLPLIDPDLEHSITLDSWLPESEDDENILPCGFKPNNLNIADGIHIFIANCWLHMFDKKMTKEEPFTRYTIPLVNDLADKPPKLQRAYLDEMYIAQKKDFLDQAAPKTKARLLATGTQEGRLLFTTFPNHQDFRMSPPAFRSIFCERAGVGDPLAFHPKCIECKCGTVLDPNTAREHIDGCNRMGGWRTNRHHQWANKWQQFFTYCNNRATTEITLWANHPNIPEDELDVHGKKISAYRADIAAYKYVNQSQRCYDISIANPCSSIDVNDAQNVALSAAARIAVKKVHKYNSPSERIGYTFVPLIAETFGGWDKAAHAELRYMMNCAHAHRGIDINRGIRHWKKVLTFAHFRAGLSVSEA